MDNNKIVVQNEDLPRYMAEKAAKCMLSKQARDVKLFRVTETTVIADYYIICTGRSSTHVKSLADEVAYQFECEGMECRIEGVESSGWLLVDLGAIIVHVFNSESRGFYKLERLLDASEEIDISHLDAPEEK